MVRQPCFIFWKKIAKTRLSGFEFKKFEAADEYFESLGSLAEGLSLDIEECLREQNVDEKVLEEWNHSISERFPMRSLGTKISNLCRKCGKKSSSNDR